MAGRVDFTSVDPEDTETAQAPRQGSFWMFSVIIENYDATGMTARMMLRKKYASAEPVLSLTETDGQLTWVSRGSAITNAELQVLVSAVDMAAVPAAETATQTGTIYHFDLEVVPGSDEDMADAIIYGDVLVLPEVTKVVAA